VTTGQLSPPEITHPPCPTWTGNPRLRHAREPYESYFTFVKPGLRTWLELLSLDVTYTKATGDRLTYADPAGREVEVLDLIGGFGACLLGHNHPEVLEVVEEHMRSLRPVLVQGSRQMEAGRLAARLSALLGCRTGKSYVCTLGNSGAEAVEIAIKLSEFERTAKNYAQLKEFRRQFDSVRELIRQNRCRATIRDFWPATIRQLEVPLDSPERALQALEEHNSRVLSRPPLFLAVQGAFHGKTTGALSLTWNPEYRSPFAAFLGDAHFVDPNDPNGVARAAEASSEQCYGLYVDETGEVRATTTSVSRMAAVIAEPVQGEGGIHELSPEFLRRCRELCDRIGVPLIFDEIQSGMGRTGRFLASEPSGVFADIYLLSKALGGGIAKISATLIDQDRYPSEFSLIHSSTFAEDPLSAKVGNTVLDLMERDGLVKLAEEKGLFLKARLAEVTARFSDAFKSVRGRGLMLGVVLSPQDRSPSPLIRQIDKAGRLAHFACGYLFHRERIRLLPTLSDPYVLRLEPSAYISYADLDRTVEALSHLGEVLTEGDARTFLGFIRRTGHRAVIARDQKPSKTGWRPSPATPVKVGFLIHFVDEGQLESLEPSFAGASAEERDRFIRALEPIAQPIPLNSTLITSVTGKQIEFRPIAIPLTSRQMTEALGRPDSSQAFALVKAGVALAREMGCEVLGLGQYTSIVTRNGLSLSEPGLAITTGNSLTVAMTLRAILKATGTKRLIPGHTPLAVVGAAGNIGSAYAALAAGYFAPLTLVGSPRPGSLDRLEAVRARILRDMYADFLRERAQHASGGVARRLRQLPLVRRLIEERADPETAVETMTSAGIADGLVSITTDLSAIRAAKVIVAVSNSTEKLIGSDMVQEGAILCDVSIPCSTDFEVIEKRPDVFFFTGGVVRLPNGERIDTPGFPLALGNVFACMAETMVMGLSGIRESLSCGAVELDTIRFVEALARYHNFRLAAFKTNFLYPSDLRTGEMRTSTVISNQSPYRMEPHGNSELRN
jgi:acetylornithine/succinyldiaminopimelate/putrescine aminotransferase/predicted amino acid dehydrogenase